MAKYTFRCEKCNKTQQLHVGFSVSTFECDCGSTMNRQMPTISKSTVYETADKQSNRKWLEDHEQILKSRKEKYFWSVEVPRMVASGVYTVETMVENGWISLDDNNKIIVNTKPVSQR